MNGLSTGVLPKGNTPTLSKWTKWWTETVSADVIQSRVEECPFVSVVTTTIQLYKHLRWAFEMKKYKWNKDCWSSNCQLQEIVIAKYSGKIFPLLKGVGTFYIESGVNKSLKIKDGQSRRKRIKHVYPDNKKSSRDSECRKCINLFKSINQTFRMLMLQRTIDSE